METKRAILAAVLSLVVIIGWNFIFPPQSPRAPQPSQTTEATDQAPQQTDVAPAPGADPFATEPVTAPAGKAVTVTTPLYRAEINTAGGLLQHFKLLGYRETIDPDAPYIDLVTPKSITKAPMGLIWNGIPTWSEAEWSVDGEDMDLSDGETGVLRLVAEINDVTLRRTLTFDAATYLIRDEVEVVGGGDPRLGRLAFTLGSTSLTDKDDHYNRTKIAWYNADGLSDEDDKDDLQQGLSNDQGVVWGALEDNYFILSLLPEKEGYTFKARLENEVYRMAMERSDIAAGEGALNRLACSYYLGPKRAKTLENASPNLTAAINYGFLDFISKPLIKLLNTFEGWAGNYGVAIILLTVLIKIIFWPLSHKSYKSMNKMKKIQPMMASIREKYKDDKQKMNQEMMQLYKTYKVNPASGCLPMIVQIPVFLGLYQALLGAIELRHASFISHVPLTDYIWLADLSAKDPYYVTPLIMGGTMFLQQKLTPAPGDPMQAKIMLFMPIFFTFIFLNFPSGLVLYWLTNNVLSIAQQWWLMRKA